MASNRRRSAAAIECRNKVARGKCGSYVQRLRNLYTKFTGEYRRRWRVAEAELVAETETESEAGGGVGDYAGDCAGTGIFGWVAGIDLM